MLDPFSNEADIEHLLQLYHDVHRQRVSAHHLPRTSADFWLMDRLGLRSGYAAHRGLGFNWAAGAAWFLTLAACTGLMFYGGVEIFFVSLPGWFIAAVIYIVGSRLLQKPSDPTPVAS